MISICKGFFLFENKNINKWKRKSIVKRIYWLIAMTYHIHCTIIALKLIRSLFPIQIINLFTIRRETSSIFHIIIVHTILKSIILIYTNQMSILSQKRMWKKMEWLIKHFFAMMDVGAKYLVTIFWWRNFAYENRFHTSIVSYLFNKF